MGDLGLGKNVEEISAPLRPPTLAAFLPWGIQRELVGALPRTAKLIASEQLAKYLFT